MGEAASGCGRGGRPDWRGHKTFYDKDRGFWHEPLTAEECQALSEAMERSLKERAARLPDEQAAIKAMFDAFDRLRELGWREAIYCPKDGSSFQVIEPGSTGIHRCHYSGEWPDGSWWIEADNDLSPSRPILFRLYPEDEAREKARREELARKFRDERDG